MIPNLRFDQLMGLIEKVFGLQASESGVAVMVDLPSDEVPDNPDWNDRRRIAAEWFAELAENLSQTPFAAARLARYRNVGTNNGDLPPSVSVVEAPLADPERASARSLPLEQLLERSSVVLSVTEFSATAPLKILARSRRFRGATLPGFSRAMIPALGLDYEKVHARVLQFKERLDRAESARIRFQVDGENRPRELLLDLRYRTGHASGGLIREPGTVGNLPSGEAYIVPYEGERSGEASRSAGELPVQFGEEVVLFRIEGNRVREVLSQGRHAELQRGRLEQEPAYGNLAELGIGVLGEWGIEAVGSTLLDEKLGVHIAFGRSEHFGGITGPSAFSDPKRVVHIDWVYVPSVQPRVKLIEMTFEYAPAATETIVRSGAYVV